MTEITFPKVLVAAPQHDSKKYCWDEWKERVKNLTYPNYDVFLADNSETDEFYKEIIGEGFKAKRVGFKQENVLKRTTEAHEACRWYALKHGYDYLLHLETDVFPPLDIIERLLTSRRKVISGVYDIFHGKSRKSMIQMNEPLDRSFRAYRVVPFIEHEEPLFYDGTIKQVYHAGIGCILIRKDVLNKIPFRCQVKNIFHADTWFANDCFLHDIPIFVDTTIMCKHLNSTWLDVADEILNPILEKTENNE
jgi:cellulose synthase/poly-beta-1,6-N-acetylglucosamine synthase-like glycosyltransferase